MVIIIMGATHTGKTNLAQYLLEKYHFPFTQIDNIKMGIIRGTNCDLTPNDSISKLTNTLWPIIKGIIDTVIENKQSIIVEGCYIPPHFEEMFTEEYRKELKPICLVFSKEYIYHNYQKIKDYSNIIEYRMDHDDLQAPLELWEENKYYLENFSYLPNQIIIKEDYEKELKEGLKKFDI